MTLNLFPSLVSRANVVITVALWRHEGILHSPEIQVSRRLLKMEEGVRENVQKLEIPNILKQDILMSIDPIGEEIRGWFQRNECLIELDMNWSTELCWTYIGFIDYKATAVNILRKLNLSNCHRFRLACLNGLDADIDELWPSVKQHFKCYLKLSPTVSNLEFYERELLLSVDDFLKKQDNGLLNSEQREEFLSRHLRKCIELRYVPAVDYYIRALNSSKRLELVLQLANETLQGNFFRPACLFFLLKIMDDSQLHQFILMSSPSILLFFLEWPLHQFFISVVNKLWATISEQDFHFVLVEIAGKVMAFKEVLLYRSFFMEFWRRGSIEYRNYCHQVVVNPMLIKLFSPLNPNYALQLLFNDTDIMQRLRMVFISEFDAMLIVIIEENQMVALGNILKKYIPAEVFMPNFEEQYENCTSEYLHRYYGDI